jgi:diphthamide synthase (EF-2-diphthine--ammonia ligase)
MNDKKKAVSNRSGGKDSLLPENVDVWGEEGEYHTMTYAGPLYRKEIKCSLGEP